MISIVPCIGSMIARVLPLLLSASYAAACDAGYYANYYDNNNCAPYTGKCENGVLAPQAERTTGEGANRPGTCGSCTTGPNGE